MQKFYTSDKLRFFFGALLIQTVSVYGVEEDNLLYRSFTVNNNHVILSNLDNLSLMEGGDLASSLANSSGFYLFATNLTMGGNIKVKNAHITAHNFYNSKDLSLNSEEGGDLTLVLYKGAFSTPNLSLRSRGSGTNPEVGGKGGSVYFYACDLPDNLKINLESQGATANVGGESGLLYCHHEGENDILKNLTVSSSTGLDQYGRNRQNGNLITAVQLPSSQSKDNAIAPFVKVLPSYPTFFLHPIQLQMVLEGLKTQYIFADPVGNEEKYGDLGKDLKRFLTTLHLFEEISDNHPIVKHYREWEGEIGASNSIAQFQSLYGQSAIMYNNYNQHNDFYGYSFYDVPLISFTFIKEQIEKIYKIFSDLEEIQEQYYRYFQEQKELTNHQQSVLHQYESLKRELSEDIQYLREQKIPLLKKEIDNQAPFLKEKKTKIAADLKKLSQKIQNHFEFSLDSLLEGLTMLCFSPNKAMGVVQGVKLLHDGVSKIKDDRGMLLDKKYLINSIGYIESKLDNVKDFVQYLQEGHIELAENNHHKIMVQQEQFERLMTDFYSQFPEEFKDLAKELDGYLQLSERLNFKVMEYNATLDLIVVKEDKIREVEELTQEKSDLFISKLDLSSPQYFGVIDQLYNSAKEILLSYFNKASRAYRFWALTNDNLLLKWYPKETQKFFSKAHFPSLMISIENSFTDVLEHSETPLLHFPAEKVSHGDGVTWSANNQTLLDRLRDDKEIFIRIPAVFEDTKAKEAQGFVGKSNVRLDNVYVWLEGARSTTNEITVHITHPGQETMVNNHNKPFKFSHLPTSTQFQYKMVGDEYRIIQDGNLYKRVDTSDKDALKYFTKIGPFTYWKINVSRNGDALDLSGLKSIKMEFVGSCQAFV